MRTLKKIAFGGDWNPEQWDETVMERDFELFDEASIDTVTVGVFAWSVLQPSEGEWDFTAMDRILRRTREAGRQVCLATATGAMPPWLVANHPDAARVDFEGRRHVYGQRHNFCPNSPSYREASLRIARALAERYGALDNLVAWHVNNEYGGACYCDHCARAFRVWLKRRYGTLEALNGAWNATFWSHRFSDWDQIVPPNALSEHWGGPGQTAFQGITLDYHRFMSDSILSCFVAEKDILKSIAPDVPVTTNFMGLFKPLDYFSWAPHLDFVSWDNYPPDIASAPAFMALSHALMSGLKGGKPFWLMEQSPATTAWRPSNFLKPPNVVRLWSWQAIAHGSESVLFFQMRRSKGACEKYHGAIINHAGRNDTRTFLECAALGTELAKFGNVLLDLETRSRVAFVFDWDSWWAVEMSDGPTRLLSYRDTAIRWYAAFMKARVNVDVISRDAPLDGYDLVVAPLLHVIQNDIAERIERFTEGGGTFLTGFLSGIVDRDDNAILADVPGAFARVCGIRIDETDALPAEEKNGLVWEAAFEPANRGVPTARGASIARVAQPFGTDSPYPCNVIFDLIRPVTAETVATYTDNWYKGVPAVTRNAFGKGHAWYLGTNADPSFLDELASLALADAGIAPIAEADQGIELCVRGGGGRKFLFALNHADVAGSVTLPKDGTLLPEGTPIGAQTRLEIPARGVSVVELG